jgi:hypothetical protein
MTIVKGTLDAISLAVRHTFQDNVAKKRTISILLVVNNTKVI